MKTAPAAILVVAFAAAAGLSGQSIPEGHLTDSQAETLARQALSSKDEKFQRGALARLETYHFKSTLAKERETVLFAQGLLQDRLGDTPRAAVTFHKLEAGWPQSPYLAEAQVVMAQAALDRGRTKEAESRLNKALGADIPAETVRRCQEMLLWCLAEQGRASEGAGIVRALQPLGIGKPTEKGLVGIMEALCADKKRSEAEGVMSDYQRLYPQGEHRARVRLDWGKLLGSAGDSRNAAKAFQKVIQETPTSPEADEARMALATLLSDGTLPPKDAAGYPDAHALLARVKKTGGKEDAMRRAIMINLRIALKEHHWPEALDNVSQFRAAHPPPGETKPVDDLRVEAVRGFAQEAIEKKDILHFMPYLDGETIISLTPAQRLDVTRALAQKGLPDASRVLIRAAPDRERPALTRAALEGLGPGMDPQGTLALLPAKGESPRESLLRAQAAETLGKWSDARAALAKAKPGPERIQALLLYLNRPAEPAEKPEDRGHDIAAWLAKAPEKGPDREPLTILAADQKTRVGEWRAALALYPANPAAANRGWVALMRATCLSRLGQRGSAMAALKEAREVAGFKIERASLEKRLGL